MLLYQLQILYSVDDVWQDNSEERISTQAKGDINIRLLYDAV